MGEIMKMIPRDLARRLSTLTICWFRPRRWLGIVVGVLLCILVAGLGYGQVDTQVTITKDSPADPVYVGQQVQLTWTVDTDPQTTSFTFDGGTLQRFVTDPDGYNLDLGSEVDLTGETASEAAPITRNYVFSADKAGTYTASGSYTGCPDCDPVVNGSTASDLTIEVLKRPTSTSVKDQASASSGSAYINEPVTLRVTVADNSGAAGSPSLAGILVTLEAKLNGGAANGTLNPTSHTLDDSGQFEATYVPAAGDEAAMKIV